MVYKITCKLTEIDYISGGVSNSVSNLKQGWWFAHQPWLERTVLHSWWPQVALCDLWSSKGEYTSCIHLYLLTDANTACRTMTWQAFWCRHVAFSTTTCLENTGQWRWTQPLPYRTPPTPLTSGSKPAWTNAPAPPPYPRNPTTTSGPKTAWTNASQLLHPFQLPL